MTLEQRVDRLEASWGKNDELVVELRDAVTVTAALEARHSRVMKDHAEWLIGQDKALAESPSSMKEHDARMKEHDERMKVLDRRISDLVSGIGEFMRRS